VEYFPRLKEIFPNAKIFAMYGLTECKRVAYLEPELLDVRRGSVGKAIPGTEVFLRSPEGEPVEKGQPGILHVRGPHLMRGYWNLPSRTQEMLIDGDIPGEKFLRTGDWFRMDDDGFLYFQGRTDDIIKSRGEKVSPAEVENALYSVPGVVEAAVVGVADEVLGQAIKAFVVVKEGSGLESRRLRKELVDRLENFMVPQEFVFMDALPKSENGKIRKKDLT
jgi:acyl-coenzyme A synthetase/AMP-(fatty) acid ligase